MNGWNGHSSDSGAEHEPSEERGRAAWSSGETGTAPPWSAAETQTSVPADPARPEAGEQAEAGTGAGEQAGTAERPPWATAETQSALTPPPWATAQAQPSAPPPWVTAQAHTSAAPPWTPAPTVVTAEPPHRARRVFTAVSLAVLVGVAVGVGIWFLIRDTSTSSAGGSGSGTAAGPAASVTVSASSSDTPSPSDTPTSSATPTPTPTPSLSTAAGYRRTQDPVGYSIDVPEGWTRTEKQGELAPVVTYDDPSDGRRIQIFRLAEDTPADSLDQAENDPGYGFAKQPGYQVLGRDSGTAWSEVSYRYDDSDLGARQVVDHRFEAADGTLYAIRAAGPESLEPDLVREPLTRALASFCPVGTECG